MGRFLGFNVVWIGVVGIGKAWAGAASINFAQGQIPYLLSGGFMGLAMVVTGATLLLLSSIRSERQVLTDLFLVLSRQLGRGMSSQFSTNGAGDGDRFV